MSMQRTQLGTPPPHSHDVVNAWEPACPHKVRALGVEEGEERQLRGELRRMEARRSAVERCGLVRPLLNRTPPAVL